MPKKRENRKQQIIDDFNDAASKVSSLTDSDLTTSSKAAKYKKEEAKDQSFGSISIFLT